MFVNYERHQSSSPERRKEFAQRYLRLEKQWEIAKNMRIAQATVSRDLKAMQQEWLTSKEVAINQIMAQMLARLDDTWPVP
jgi:hypothetical protein